MKDVFGTLRVNDKEYKYSFNLNVLSEIQAKYGSIAKWGDLTGAKDGAEPDLEAVIFGFTAMLNEGMEIDTDDKGTKTPLFTQKQVGRLLTQVGMAEATEQMQKTIIASTDNGEKNA